jgi:transposase
VLLLASRAGAHMTGSVVTVAGGSDLHSMVPAWCLGAPSRHGAVARRRAWHGLPRRHLDAGYQGPKMAAAVARTGRWKIEIVRRCDRHKFVVLPKRWIVERTIGWISRNRRLARDFERHCRIAAAFVRMAMIRIMLRRLAAKPSA